MSQLLRAAILIVSDTASQDPSTDRSSTTLKEVFTSEGADKWLAGNDDILTQIVPDDRDRIQDVVKKWTDPASNDEDVVNLIVTTGGTGFTPRDNTPEAISPLLHRQAPGIVHAMLAASFQVTPFAMMSRPVAGVRNKTVIVTLPGSPKGARENLQAVLKLLPHACLQAAGEDSRAAHVGGTKKLEKDAGVSANAANNPNAPATTADDGVSGAGLAVRSKHDHGHNHDHNHNHNHDHAHSHSHSHSHGHSHGGHQVPKAHTTPEDRPPQSNDPRLGASYRARSSPYPMLAVSDAIAKIIEVTPLPQSVSKPLTPELAGSYLASDVTAAEAVPAYRASIVDGYAIIVPEAAEARGKTKGIFPVASVSHAQASSMPPPLKQGEIARITTGAPLPENANAVVMVEDTVIASLTTSSGSPSAPPPEEKEVEILTSALVPGENVREPGSDVSLGSTILFGGQRISPLGGEIGVLAAAGIREVSVFRRPRVGVLSTGDEVTDISHRGPLSGGMIRDSNRPSLLTLVRGWGLCEEVVDLGIARDTPHDELERSLRDGFRVRDLDVIVTTGGVSMGELDLLKPTVERSLGGTVHFGRVNMKPGKPTTFASFDMKTNSGGGDGDGGGRSDASPSRAANDRTRKLIFGLPGNPASALVTANLFLYPCLQRLAGAPGRTSASASSSSSSTHAPGPSPELPSSTADPSPSSSSSSYGLEQVTVWLTSRVRCDPSRPEYHRCVVSMDRDNGSLVATSTGMQRSSRVASLATANGLLCLPAKAGRGREKADGAGAGAGVGVGAGTRTGATQPGYLEAFDSCECLLMGPILGSVPIDG